MTQKIPCPTCGELNYEASPLCWKCGSPMKPKPAAPPAQDPVVAAAAPVAPPPIPDPPTPSTPDPKPAIEPPTPSPEHPTPAADSQPSAPSPQASPKPAELEAAALKDKDYVTPPVDVEETPSSVGEWLGYGWAAVKGAGPAFKQALDDYDARRGRKSGGMSSYGCVAGLVVIAIVIVLLVMIVQFMAGHRGVS